jgi:anti-sigma B factor antagonist
MRLLMRRQRVFMAIEATVRRSDDVTIVDLSGRIVLGESADQIHDLIAHALASGDRKFLLNMASVSYMDSLGIGELVRSCVRVTCAGGGMKLLHVQSRIANLLQITKLRNVFEVFADEAVALSSFCPKTEIDNPVSSAKKAARLEQKAILHIKPFS